MLGKGGTSPFRYRTAALRFCGRRERLSYAGLAVQFGSSASRALLYSEELRLGLHGSKLLISSLLLTIDSAEHRDVRLGRCCPQSREFATRVVEFELAREARKTRGEVNGTRVGRRLAASSVHEDGCPNEDGKGSKGGSQTDRVNPFSEFLLVEPTGCGQQRAKVLKDEQC